MTREKKTMTRLHLISRTARIACALAFTAVLAACSGGGPGTVQNPVTSAPPVLDYNGPPAQNADVQAFKNELWKNINANNRCGQCHNAGGQTPQFARNDDINAAYNAANTVVNLTQPDQSRMVQKVGGGHNCWLAAASACADTLTVWIRNWAGASATGGTQIELQAPTIKEVGASKTFPDDATAFAANVYPVLHDTNRGNCVRCHSSTAGTPQSPFFASNDIQEAYAAAKAKINLDIPANSRFVVRLRDEFHNCWAPTGTTNCVDSAKIMQDAIQAYANSIPATQVDPSLVISKALTLYDGTVAAGGNRHDTNVIARYEFKTHAGLVAYDTSGVEPALNLALTSTTMWAGGWGINIAAGQNAKGSTQASKKLSDNIKSTGEFTIEAWMAPANVVQEDAYAVTYSGGTAARNFTLAQRAYQYQVMTRASNTDANGAPALLTKDTDRDAQASLQHVVLTYDPVNGRRLYVNGKATGDPDPKGVGGTLSDWDDSFALILGNETSLNRQWTGLMKFLAIHNRALTPDQIQQNFAAGVGERYFLLFSVSHLVDVPKAYVMFEASEYDSYAYVFNKPTFISLDPTADPGSITVKGMRIGVNGAESRVGQTYGPLSATIGGTNYNKLSGQLMANVGAVIGEQKGPLSDEFFLSFEQIGTHSHTHDDPDGQASTAPVVDPPPPPRFGIRTFDEINATYARLTGVSPNAAGVASTYANVKQQLPSVESVNSFLASQQTGVAQLAIAYCNALVKDDTLRPQFFGAGMDPNASASIFNDPTTRATLIDAIKTKIIGSTSIQPDSALIDSSLTTMLTKLAGGSAGTAMKAACAAALGSAATTVQ
jgi:hypothetical protein